MRNFTKFLIAATAVSMGLSDLSAADFTVDNVNYTLLSASDLTCSLAAGNYSGKLVIPATVNFNGRILSVVSVDDDAISKLPELTAVEIGPNVVTIGKHAFNDTPKLEKLVIPANVNRIEPFSFVRCGIKELVVEDSPKALNIGVSDFSTVIGRPSCGTFLECSNLEKVTWLRDYSQIKDPEVRYSEFRVPFGEATGFSYKSAIKEVIIGGHGKCAFLFCPNIEKITLEEGVEQVSGFRQCKVKTIHMPSSVKLVSDDAFYGCTELTEAPLREGIEKVNKGSFEHTGIKEVTIPSSVTKFDYAYDSLEKVTICTNCEYKYGFVKCKELKEVTFAPNVNVINEAPTFNVCPLEVITVENPVPPTVKGEFTSSQYLNTVVYCPINSVEDYKKAPIWKNFWNIEGKVMDSGVEEITAVEKAVVKYYNLNGVELQNEPETGAYIKVEGGKSSKILKK